jgi:hypothetical protein
MLNTKKHKKLCPKTKVIPNSMSNSNKFRPSFQKHRKIAFQKHRPMQLYNDKYLVNLHKILMTQDMILFKINIFQPAESLFHHETWTDECQVTLTDYLTFIYLFLSPRLLDEF